MPPATVVISMMMLSFKAMAVVVKSDKVLESILVPVESDKPLVLIEFPTTGMAVPVATFQNFTVTVPWSAARL